MHPRSRASLASQQTRGERARSRRDGARSVTRHAHQRTTNREWAGWVALHLCALQTATGSSTGPLPAAGWPSSSLQAFRLTQTSCSSFGPSSPGLLHNRCVCGGGAGGGGDFAPVWTAVWRRHQMSRSACAKRAKAHAQVHKHAQCQRPELKAHAPAP